MKNMIIGIGMIVLAGLWYAFRPELLFVNKQVNEPFPTGAQVPSGPVSLAKGNFKSLAHETQGLATIYKLANDKQTLRLTKFETSNGPDVHVYLTAAELEKGSDAIKTAGFIDLGSMKGNERAWHRISRISNAARWPRGAKGHQGQRFVALANNSHPRQRCRRQPELARKKAAPRVAEGCSVSGE